MERHAFMRSSGSPSPTNFVLPGSASIDAYASKCRSPNAVRRRRSVSMIGMSTMNPLRR